MDVKFSTLAFYLLNKVSAFEGSAAGLNNETTAKPTPELEGTNSKTDGSTAYNIEDDFQAANESKMPEIFLVIGIVVGLLIIGAILFCVCRKSKKDAPIAEEVDELNKAKYNTQDV